MQDQLSTDRKMKETEVQKIIEQRCCQTLLFKLMKYQTILFLVLGVLSFSLLCPSIKEFQQYQPYNNSLTIQDYVLILTTAHQHHCEKQNLYTFYLTEESNFKCILTKQKNISQAYVSKASLTTPCIKQNISSNVLEIENKSIDQQNSKGNNFSITNDRNTIDQKKNCSDHETSLDNSHPQLKQGMDYSRDRLMRCFIYDSILQYLLCVGTAIIQYLSFRDREEEKDKFIESYSLELYNLPIKQPYIILPKLQAYIIKLIKDTFHVITQNSRDPEIFSTTSVIAQQEVNQFKLNNEIKQRVSQGIKYANVQENHRNEILDELQKKIQKINSNLIKISHTQATSDIVWITFETRKARYLALRSLQYTKQMFMDYRIKVRSAPHPLQIIWSSLHQNLAKIIFTRTSVIVIFLVILLVIDLFILYIQKIYPFLYAIIATIIIELILKQIIVYLSKYGQYRHKSKQDLSIFCNLIKFLYINNALITFISSYNFGDYQIVQFFSTSMYQGIGYNWFYKVGIAIILGFICRIVLGCVRPYGSLILAKLKKCSISQVCSFIGCKKSKKKDGEQQIIKEQQLKKKQQKQQKLPSQLDICYATIICVLMFGNTYTFTHPIFYLLMAAFFAISIATHTSYIANHVEPAPYNTDILNHTAIQYMYYSVVLHWIFIYITYRVLFTLIFAASLSVILIFKNTLLEKILDILRAKNGPFFSQQFNKMSSQTDHLSELLSMEQMNQQIQTLENKMRQYTFLYNEKNLNGDVQKKQELDKYIATLQEKINKLEKNKELLNIKKQISKKEDKKEKVEKVENKIKGAISYSLTQKMFNL